MGSTILFIVLITIAASFSWINPHPYKCQRTHCGQEYYLCIRKLSCIVGAVKCQRQCGGTVNQCALDCAYNSGDYRLRNFAWCADEYCRAYSPQCPVDKCSKIYSELCKTSPELHADTCLAQFFTENPDCECVKNH